MEYRDHFLFKCHLIQTRLNIKRSNETCSIKWAIEAICVMNIKSGGAGEPFSQSNQTSTLFFYLFIFFFLYFGWELLWMSNGWSPIDDGRGRTRSLWKQKIQEGTTTVVWTIEWLNHHRFRRSSSTCTSISSHKGKFTHTWWFSEIVLFIMIDRHL